MQRRILKFLIFFPLVGLKQCQRATPPLSNLDNTNLDSILKPNYPTTVSRSRAIHLSILCREKASASISKRHRRDNRKMAPKATPARRFELGSSTQPLVQFVAATFPFFLLLLWFLFDAHWRPDSDCYSTSNNNNVDVVSDEDRAQACGNLIPLTQYLTVFLMAELVWMLLAFYLMFYVPRRHTLIGSYLTQGETVIGDVFFETEDHQSHVCLQQRVFALTSYGHVVYPQPDTASPTPSTGMAQMVRRKVPIFERYTRERSAIVLLPGMPHSGQPKLDLEIDLQVIVVNHHRLEILRYYAWAWTAFCTLAPLYIVKVLNELIEDNNQQYETVWQPDVGSGRFVLWFYISAFAFIPAMSIFWIFASWFYYKHWMTNQHKIVANHPASPRTKHAQSCCFDDTDCESIEIAKYTPPTAIDGRTDVVSKN